MSQDRVQEARVVVRVESTRKIAVIAGKRRVDHRARRHLRRREAGIAPLAAGQDRRGEKSDILGVGLVHPVLIDLVDR